MLLSIFVNRRLLMAEIAAVGVGLLMGYWGAAGVGAEGVRAGDARAAAGVGAEGVRAGDARAADALAQAAPNCPGCPPIIICPGCPPQPHPPCHGCPILLPCPPDPLMPPPPPGVPTAPPRPTPTPGPAGALTYKICPQISGRIPPALEQMALADPWKFRGYGQLRNPNVPAHPLWNTYRTWLSLENMNVPYHRCNPVVWKAGCP